MKKKVIVAVRVASHIAELIKQEAKKNGIKTSAWVREIILKELRKRGYAF